MDHYWTYFSASANHIVDTRLTPPGYTLCGKVADLGGGAARRLTLEQVMAQSTCSICDSAVYAAARRIAAGEVS